MLDRVLGLTDLETRAYRALVAAPSASAGELAGELADPDDEVQVALVALERHGLAARQSGDGDRWAAAPPAIALGALLARRQNEVRLAELELGRLEELYRVASAGRGPTDVIDVVHGADAVRQRFAQLQLGAQHGVDAFVRGPVAVVSAAENDAEDQAVARGVRYRAVIDPAMLRAGELTLAQAAAAAAAGEEIRFADDVPLKLVLIDRRLAFLPVAEADAPEGPAHAVGALLVHQSGLLDALVALWETWWSAATPLVTGAQALADDVGPHLEDADAQVLGLLLGGLTDEAIGKQLGMSLRTVQRRVRALMELAGVSTRLQLGWHAARRGWVPGA